MPQKLIATDRPTSHAASRPTPPRRDIPIATSGRANDDVVVAEAVAELDPTLAEVHQVDERDRHHGEGAARDQPRLHEPSKSRQDVEIGRAREQDAHAGRARQGNRAGRVEQPPDRARGGAQEGPVAEAVGDAIGEDHGRREQHDPEILGHVADVLDVPGRVVAERRVPIRLELVEIVIDRGEEMPGRDEVVDQERRDRDGRAEPGRERPAGVRPAASHEDEEWRPEDDGQAGRAGDAEQEPGGELPTIDERPGPVETRHQHRGLSAEVQIEAAAARRASARLGTRHRIRLIRVSGERSVAPQGDPDRQDGGRQGHHVSEEPGGAEPGRVPEHRPEPEEDRHRQPDGPPDRQAAQQPPAEADVDRPDHHRDQPLIGREAPDRDDGHEDDGRQGRERQEPVTRQATTGIADGKDILEVVVSGHGPGDLGATVQEGDGLPDEVVVVADRAWQPVGRQGDRHEGEHR